MLGVLAATVPIFVIIGIGYAAVRASLFSRRDVEAMGRFVLAFALPALLFKTLSQEPLRENLNTSYLLAYGLGSVAVMLLGVCFSYFLRGLDLRASALNGMGMSFSNSAFVGYPIALQLFGPLAGTILALVMLVENLVMMPLTIVLAESGGSSGQRPSYVLRWIFLSLLRNPIILAIAAGITVAVLGLAAAPVALFVIGGTLVGLKLRGLVAGVSQILLGKLLLHPLAVLSVVLLLPPFDPQLQMAAVLFAAAPMLSIYPILGQRYGYGDSCAAALMATTVASFVTINAVVGALETSGLFGVGG